MRQADAQEASGLLYAKPFCEVYRVIISIPGEEAPFTQVCCQLKWSMAVYADSERWAALRESFRVGDAVEL